MVRYIQITQVPPQWMALWRSWLSPQRRKRAERMPDDREMVCGEGLARELLAAALQMCIRDRGNDPAPLVKR